MTGPLALGAALLAFSGIAHCAAMCGGFVASAFAPAPGAEPRLRPLLAALALHGGRLASYATAGAIAGSAWNPFLPTHPRSIPAKAFGLRQRAVWPTAGQMIKGSYGNTFCSRLPTWDHLNQPCAPAFIFRTYPLFCTNYCFTFTDINNR